MNENDPARAYRDNLRRMTEESRKSEAREEARLRGTLDAEERRFMAHLDRLLDEPGRRRAEAFSGEMGALAISLLPPRGSAPRSLADLDLRGLHTVARLDSVLRHSIVENCLMNLRNLAAAVAERGGDPALRAKLGKHLDLLPAVLKQISDFFGEPLVLGVALRDLLPHAWSLAFTVLKHLSHMAESRREDVDAARLDRRIDDLQDALAEVRRELDRHRKLLPALAQQALDVMAEHSDLEGVAVTVRDETEGTARLFVDEPRLVNAVAEALRNAARQGAHRIAVRITEAPPPSTDTRILIEDDGPGFPEEILARAGERGYSTTGGGAGLSLLAEAAATHFGSLELTNPPSGGARVALVLPRYPVIHAVDPEPRPGLDLRGAL